MSSLVTGPERSVAGKITRAGLLTRSSRPPASTIVLSDAAMLCGTYGTGPARHTRSGGRRRREARLPSGPPLGESAVLDAEDDDRGELHRPAGRRPAEHRSGVGAAQGPADGDAIRLGD